MRNWIGAALLLISAAAANAQTPYAGMQMRSIKALSEQQVADLVHAYDVGPDGLTVGGWLKDRDGFGCSARSFDLFGHAGALPEG